MRLLSDILPDADRIGDVIGAFGLLLAVVAGCWIGEGLGVWL